MTKYLNRNKQPWLAVILDFETFVEEYANRNCSPRNLGSRGVSNLIRLTQVWPTSILPF